MCLRVEFAPDLWIKVVGNPNKTLDWCLGALELKLPYKAVDQPKTLTTHPGAAVESNTLSSDMRSPATNPIAAVESGFLKLRDWEHQR